MAVRVFAQTSPQKDFEAAKQKYEQSSHDETARVAYVTKLAQLKIELLKVPNEQDDLKRAINSECQKLPYPKDVDSKKLKQLIVGKWASPRRHYVYLANGKWGQEGGAITGNWRIQGNQLIQGDVIERANHSVEPGILYLFRPEPRRRHRCDVSFTGKKLERSSPWHQILAFLDD